jgi:hypothetical protein
VFRIPKQELDRYVCMVFLTLSAVGVSIGLIVWVAGFMFNLSPLSGSPWFVREVADFFRPKPLIPQDIAYTFSAISIGSAVVFFVLASVLYVKVNSVIQPTSEIRFGRHAVGLSFFLLVTATMCMVTLAGLGYSGVLQWVLPIGNDGEVAPIPPSAASLATACQIGLSLAMAIVGALLWIIRSLHEKRTDGILFSVTEFWGGLWKRLGEAIVLTLFVFMLLRVYSPSIGARMMPLVALVLGLNLRAAEHMVYGLSETILGIISRGLPAGRAGTPSTAATAGTATASPLPITPGMPVTITYTPGNGPLRVAATVKLKLGYNNWSISAPEVGMTKNGTTWEASVTPPPGATSLYCRFADATGIVDSNGGKDWIF